MAEGEEFQQFKMVARTVHEPHTKKRKKKPVQDPHVCGCFSDILTVHCWSRQACEAELKLDL